MMRFLPGMLTVFIAVSSMSSNCWAESSVTDLQARTLKLEQKRDALKKHKEKLTRENQELQDRTRENGKKYKNKRDELNTERLYFDNEITSITLQQISGEVEINNRNREIAELEAKVAQSTDAVKKLDSYYFELKQTNKRLTNELRILEAYQAFNSVENAACVSIQPGPQLGTLKARCAYTTGKDKSWKGLSWNDYVYKIGICDLSSQGLKMMYNSKNKANVLSCSSRKTNPPNIEDNYY